MRLIDADALRERLLANRGLFTMGSAARVHAGACIAILDVAPSIACAADNPHGLVPSKCPTCGETLVPYPCMDLAQDSYRDGMLYGQEHPEWGANG